MERKKAGQPSNVFYCFANLCNLDAQPKKNAPEGAYGLLKKFILLQRTYPDVAEGDWLAGVAVILQLYR